MPTTLVKRFIPMVIFAASFGPVSNASAAGVGDRFVLEEEFSALFEPDPGEVIQKRGLAKVGVRPGFDSKKREATIYVLFEAGSILLKSPDSFQQLDAAGRAFKKALEVGKAEKWMIEIAGHTDNVGSPETNIKLSKERAESVRQYLLQTYGLPQTMVSAYGYGDANPIASNDTPDGREKNRRVVFRVAQRDNSVMQTEKNISVAQTEKKRSLREPPPLPPHSPCGSSEDPFFSRSETQQGWLVYPVPVPDGTACILVPRTLPFSAWEKLKKQIDVLQPPKEE